MTLAAWFELIDSYVSGRLSADSFKRRFGEAFGAAVERREGVPEGVQALAYVVEAYAGDPTARGHDVADDADMMRAARAALAELSRLIDRRVQAEAQAPPREETAVQLDVETLARETRRAAITFGGVALMGCVGLIAYVAIAALQFFAIADQVQSVAKIGAVLATVSALILCFVPLVGGVIAYFGATDLWGWSPWLAGVVFVILPAVLFFFGLRPRLQARSYRGRRP